MMGNYFEGGYGFGGLGFIFMILFWGLIVWVIVKLIKGGGNHASCCGGNKSLNILKERYARGEISKEQYDQMKKDIVS